MGAVLNGSQMSKYLPSAPHRLHLDIRDASPSFREFRRFEIRRLVRRALSLPLVSPSGDIQAATIRSPRYLRRGVSFNPLVVGNRAKTVYDKIHGFQKLRGQLATRNRYVCLCLGLCIWLSCRPSCYCHTVTTCGYPYRG